MRLAIKVVPSLVTVHNSVCDELGNDAGGVMRDNECLAAFTALSFQCPYDCPRLKLAAMVYVCGACMGPQG